MQLSKGRSCGAQTVPEVRRRWSRQRTGFVRVGGPQGTELEPERFQLVHLIPAPPCSLAAKNKMKGGRKYRADLSVCFDSFFYLSVFPVEVKISLPLLYVVNRFK